MGLTDQCIRDALRQVIDPHFNVPLEDMGMLRSIVVSDQREVEIGIAVPCIGCPALDVMRGEIKEAVKAIGGVERVLVKLDWSAEWKKSDLSPVAVQKARSHGYRI